MAKRSPRRRGKTTGRRRAWSRKLTAKRVKAHRSGKRPTRKHTSKRRASTRKATARSKAGANPTIPKRAARTKSARKKALRRGPPQLDRARRTLGDEEIVPTPPSSLNLDRHGSAARSGREALVHSRKDLAGMTPAITGGDVDVDVENAYFSGDEAPGGDNPTPDQDVVEDIGKALGVEYQDNEELRPADKVVERDKHRWELDPASSEDYKERK
jgi:hypothetical protein